MPRHSTPKIETPDAPEDTQASAELPKGTVRTSRGNLRTDL